MKHLLRVAGSVCAVLIFSLYGPRAFAQQIQVSNQNRTLAITASGTASRMADTATVHVGFLVYGAGSASAYAAGSKLSNAITKAIAAEHVPAGQIQSESQNLAETPQFELDKLTPAEQAQRRYQLRQSWTVQTSAKQAAEVLNAAVKAGANQSGQIDWSVADESGLEAQAAGNALTRAKAIAAQMASGLGIQLGNLVYASNQVAEGPRPIMMRAMAAPAGPIATGPEPLAINPRKVERSATVYAVFAIQ